MADLQLVISSFLDKTSVCLKHLPCSLAAECHANFRSRLPVATSRPNKTIIRLTTCLTSVALTSVDSVFPVKAFPDRCAILSPTLRDAPLLHSFAGVARPDALIDRSRVISTRTKRHRADRFGVSTPRTITRGRARGRQLLATVHAHAARSASAMSNLDGTDACWTKVNNTRTRVLCAARGPSRVDAKPAPDGTELVSKRP
jgi:hypothetical protein